MEITSFPDYLLTTLRVEVGSFETGESYLLIKEESIDLGLCFIPVQHDKQ